VRWQSLSAYRISFSVMPRSFDICWPFDRFAKVVVLGAATAVGVHAPCSHQAFYSFPDLTMSNERTALAFEL
jgi:hypothetical protein